MTKLSRADVVAWVAAVYATPDAEQWVTDGPAAFLVRLDDGQALLVRRRTGDYWAFPRETDLYTARSDRRLRRQLGKLVFDIDRPMGMIHDPSLDLTEQQLRTWLDATYGQQLIIGQILDRGWAFLAIKGQIMYGGETGSQSATLVVVKRTGEVWDLLPGRHLEAALCARTEAGFRQQLAMVTSTPQPTAQIPR